MEGYILEDSTQKKYSLQTDIEANMIPIQSQQKFFVKIDKLILKVVGEA